MEITQGESQKQVKLRGLRQWAEVVRETALRWKRPLGRGWRQAAKARKQGRDPVPFPGGRLGVRLA